MKDKVALVLHVHEVNLKRKSDNHVLTPEELHLVLAETLIILSSRFPHVFPVIKYVEHEKPFRVSVISEKHPRRTYLVPAFNGITEPNIKVEYTCCVEQQYVIMA